mmetsp:Transcript_100910/g.314593  ORF Transcript_100910/g.314593 Transcript_100910/m.314593 type:complete len:319 (+) Transcript_100910:152-1108(+)
MQSKRLRAWGSANNHCLAARAAQAAPRRALSLPPPGSPRATQRAARAAVCTKSASRNQPTSAISGKPSAMSLRPNGNPGRGCTQDAEEVHRGAAQSTSSRAGCASATSRRGTAAERQGLAGRAAPWHAAKRTQRPRGATRNHLRPSRARAAPGPGTAGERKRCAESRKKACEERYPKAVSKSLQSQAGAPGGQKTSRPSNSCAKPKAVQAMRKSWASELCPGRPRHNRAQARAGEVGIARPQRWQRAPTTPGSRSSNIRSRGAPLPHSVGASQRRASTLRSAAAAAPGAKRSSNWAPNVSRTSCSVQLLGAQRPKSSG